MVEFSDLSLRVKAPGNLTEEQLDEVLAFLQQRVQLQERTERSRLHHFYKQLNK